MPGWDTAGNILNDAAVELGLRTSDLADPYASQDQAIALLCRLLKGLGQDMVRDYQWTHLQGSYTFTLVPGDESYPLPGGFVRPIDQTQWNLTQRMPMLGPLSPQGWQLLQALTSAGVVDIYFRTVGDRFVVYPTPQSADAVSFEYVTSYWVQPIGQTLPTLDAPAAATDTLWFDRRLLVLGLKWAWLEAKSLPQAAAAENAYRLALTRAQGGDGAAPVLSLNNRPFAANRMLDCANVPETGFGVP
ncbi:phage adaptor protein [Myxococcus landrumensis]|uniref:Uncharacterized protein n=1 Tax=Myxococcus landrumensis TaxID=2813577 RepID=A0ABX7N8S5_9BACT|nr:hypothetical protein [Myxococcus landrumus]QSQ14047.1 hypothetical protein JY572_37995 [Myxococcus landrumus]